MTYLKIYIPFFYCLEREVCFVRSVSKANEIEFYVDLFTV